MPVFGVMDIKSNISSIIENSTNSAEIKSAFEKYYNSKEIQDLINTNNLEAVVDKFLQHIKTDKIFIPIRNESVDLINRIKDIANNFGGINKFAFLINSPDSQDNTKQLMSLIVNSSFFSNFIVLLISIVLLIIFGIVSFISWIVVLTKNKKTVSTISLVLVPLTGLIGLSWIGWITAAFLHRRIKDNKIVTIIEEDQKQIEVEEIN